MEADTSFDWWSQPEVAAILLKQFKKHIVGLFVAVKEHAETAFRQVVFSGFLLRHSGVYFWVSAGHVVNRVRALVDSQQKYDCVLRWADDYHKEGAESVPANIIPSQVFSVYNSEDDPDFGVIAISNFDAECLLRNENLVPMDERIWYKHESARPAGYYLIGFPEEGQSSKEFAIGDDIKRHGLEYSYWCLPVQKLEYDNPEVNKSIFANPTDFYDKLMLPLGDGGLHSVVAMSGGPILSIERKGEQFTYRLYGVQKSWDRSRLVIRGEHIGRVAEIIAPGAKTGI
jgi:hypothetical protein